MGIVQKIFYFHVPSAYAMYLGAAACFVGSVGYLVRPTDARDASPAPAPRWRSSSARSCLTTGPLWGAKAWGHYWTWDPRLTTALLERPHLRGVPRAARLRRRRRGRAPVRRGARRPRRGEPAHHPLQRAEVGRPAPDGHHRQRRRPAAPGHEARARPAASSRSRCSPCSSSGRARGSSSRSSRLRARRGRRDRSRARHEDRSMSTTQQRAPPRAPAATDLARRSRDDVPGRRGRSRALQRRRRCSSSAYAVALGHPLRLGGARVAQAERARRAPRRPRAGRSTKRPPASRRSSRNGERR